MPHVADAIDEQAGAGGDVADEFVVDRDHPALAGHFPGNPIVPGAIVLAEALVVVERRVGSRVGRVARAKFPAVLVPGVKVRLHVQHEPSGRYRVTCSASETTFLDALVEVDS